MNDITTLSIKKNKDGVYYWKTRINGKQVKRENKRWKSKKDARLHYSEFIKKYKEAEITISRLRWDELADLYIEFISMSLKQSTVDSHRSRLNVIRKKYISNVFIDNITPATIQSIQSKMLNDKVNDKPLSNQYLKLLQGSIKSMLDYAVNFNYVKTNPFNQVPLVKHRTFEKKVEMTILTLEEANAL